MRVQALAPQFDEATEFTLKWYERTRDSTAGKYELRELLKDDVTRQLCEEINEQFNPDVILYFNHGSEAGLAEQGGGGYVIDTQNIGKFAGKVIITVACLSAKNLGVQAWKLKCVYVGYTDLFYLTFNDEKLFGEASSHGFVLYVNGETDWKSIKQQMIDKFNETTAKTNDPWSQMWLRHDRDCLVVYDGQEPETRCLFRKIALKLFGHKYGWKL